MENKLEKLQGYLNSIQDIFVAKKEELYIHNGYFPKINSLRDKDVILHGIYFSISPKKGDLIEPEQLNSLLRRLIPEDIEITSEYGLDTLKEIPERYLARNIKPSNRPGIFGEISNTCYFTLPKAYFNEKIGEQILERNYTFSDKILQNQMKEKFPEFKKNKLITKEKRDYIRQIKLIVLPNKDFDTNKGFNPAGKKAQYSPFY